MSEEKTGTPVLGVSGQRGIPKSVGADQGASGAQLSGIEIHAHPPNQQLSHAISSSSCPSISSTILFIISTIHIISRAESHPLQEPSLSK